MLSLPFTLTAHAKINLRLRVGRIGDAGLHAIQTLMADVELSDELRFEDAPGGFRVECDPPLLPESENLAWRAPMNLRSPLPAVRIGLLKRIPLQAGLGGGSADAAAALRGVAMIMEAGGERVSPQALAEAAFRAGADVPACLHEGLKMVEGFGEHVRPIGDPLPSWPIVLSRGGAGVSTARAYALLDENRSTAATRFGASEAAREETAVDAMRRALASSDFSRFGQLLHNDFTDVVERAYPEIAGTRKRLEELGAQATLLCGSGSCVAGFYEREADARAAMRALTGQPDAWSALTTFVRAGGVE